MLRELIRTPGPNCFPLSISRVFSRLGVESLSERVITRAAPPCTPIAIALAISLLGVKSVNACARDGKNVETYAMRYAERLNTLRHLYVDPE